MLHWFADLMNVTEEVTIHRPWGQLTEQLISRTYASYDIWEGWENSVPGLNELIFMFLSNELTVYSFITNQTTRNNSKEISF